MRTRDFHADSGQVVKIEFNGSIKVYDAIYRTVVWDAVFHPQAWIPSCNDQCVMKKLSLIISALNEGDEPLKTVASIRQISPKDEIDIIVINDGTHENQFQPGWVDIPDAYVIHHTTRMGRPFSMEEGVTAANTKYIGLLNARLRFFPGWYEKVIHALENYPDNIIFQTTAVLLNAEREIVTSNNDNGKRYGAHVHYFRNNEILKAYFYRYPQKNDNIYNIPGLLGANYFTTKKWYKKIKGWQGLYDYGGMDVFLALKSWVLGGQCKLIQHAEIGNIYRKWQYTDHMGHALKPYADKILSYYYNKLFIGFVLLSLKDALHLLSLLKKIAPGYYQPVKERLVKNDRYIKTYRQYINTNKKNNVYNFINRKTTY